MGNTELTKSCVVAAAYELACQIGLLQISVRTVAAKAGFSKTGTITHFKNLETLQLAVLDHAAQLFAQDVFLPALATERGLPRLKRIFELWVQRNSDPLKNCLFISAAFEVDSRPGPIREHIKCWMAELRTQIGRSIEMSIEEQHLSSSCDIEGLAFTIFSLATGVHHDIHLLNRADGAPRALSVFEKLLRLDQ